MNYLTQNMSRPEDRKADDSKNEEFFFSGEVFNSESELFFWLIYMKNTSLYTFQYKSPLYISIFFVQRCI